MKIRSKAGEAVDLAYERVLGESLYRDMPDSPSAKAFLAILDALEAACSVPRRGMWDKSDPLAWNAALDAVEEAAGVIEE